VQKVLDRQKANKVKPLPKVKIVKKTPKYVLVPAEDAWQAEITTPHSPLPDPPSYQQPATRRQVSALSAQLLKDERDIHIARNKLSNYYHELEANQAPLDAFRQNYDAVEAYTRQLQELFLKKRHLEQYGRLPDERPSGDHPDLPRFKHERTRLHDKKYRLKKNLELTGKYPPGSAKHQDFLYQLDQVETELQVLHRKIKKMER